MSAPAIAVRETPILMSGPMVRAILDGRKGQTRRVVTNLNPTFVAANPTARQIANAVGCPYGQPGDRMWVREAWQVWVEYEKAPIAEIPENVWRHVNYPADGNRWPTRTRSPIHMPRRASRIVLQITDVRVERVQEITRADVEAEGLVVSGWDWRAPFHRLWDELNAKRGYGWDMNPWVFVLSFQRVEP